VRRPPKLEETIVDLLADAQWQVAGTAPGAVSDPAGLAGLPDWIPAPVPGTAVGALLGACGAAQAPATDVDGQDWWWRTTVHIDAALGPWVLTVGGLATLADVWVDGRLVLHSENMFRGYAVDLDGLDGQTDIVIRCAAALPEVTVRQPRPRWRSSLVAHQGWRFMRTSLLGRMPGWAQGAAPVGPWRPVRLHAVDRPVVVRRRMAATLEDGFGIVRAEFEVRAPAPVQRAALRVGGTLAAAHVADRPGGPGCLISATVRIPHAEPWWPWTHGAQPRYPARLEIDGRTSPLAPAGFRTVEADTSDGGFTLRVNAVPIFARGACWMPLDPVSLQAVPGQTGEALRQVRDGGFNMLRIVGTTVYEDDAFYEACDEYGILVWQDCMLASLDPPAAGAFIGEVRAEVQELADRLAGHPCIAVVSGGSEIQQQPAMLGLPKEAVASPVIDTVIPSVLAERLPGVPYLPSSPAGGSLPMQLRIGVAHYFGVGAYLRPLADVRTAGVRFAAECLAFSIPPEPTSVRALFRMSRVAGHDPVWKVGVPRDAAASWDFEDVRDYYVRHLFQTDPLLVRYCDPDRYLDLGRAAVCVAMSEVFTHWRRPGSGNSGGLILALRDLVAGAGFGLVDVLGQPKAPWYVLRRLLAPVAVLVSDDGLDGISLTMVNDTAHEVAGELSVRLWSPHGAPTAAGAAPVVIPARSAAEVPLDAILGRFTDAGHAYRFGPRQHDVLHAVLSTGDPPRRIEQVFLFGNQLRPVRRGGLVGVLAAGDDGWRVDVTAEKLTQWVALSADGYRPSDSWFHLAPGMTRTVRLISAAAQPGRPAVAIRALNVEETWSIVQTPG
jgi:beta-mannosidase